LAMVAITSRVPRPPAGLRERHLRQTLTELPRTTTITGPTSRGNKDPRVRAWPGRSM
jgi:hypothetical protein